jgi:phosphatidate cytidylyltransferase
MTDPETGAPGFTGFIRQAFGSSRFGDLAMRFVSALVLVAVALGSAWLGGTWFNAVWLVAALAIHWEWQAMLGRDRQRLRFAFGAVALAIASPAILVAGGALSLGVILIGAAAVATQARPASPRLAAAGVVYAGALLIAVELLRASFPYGLEAILWLFAVVWGTDTMAYFGGRLFGGPKLWPRLSPSKTWSGFLIGITSGALAGLAVAPSPGPYRIIFVLGLIAAVVSQGGDLFESALKRRFGVKDASHLIPGHGGVMDRLDGFTAAAVCAAILGVVRFGSEVPAAGLFRW